MRGMDVGVDTHGNDRRVPGRHGLPALFEEEGEGVTGEPTVPVPIPDLLARVETLEQALRVIQRVSTDDGYEHSKDVLASRLNAVKGLADAALAGQSTTETPS